MKRTGTTYAGMNPIARKKRAIGFFLATLVCTLSFPQSVDRETSEILDVIRSMNRFPGAYKSTVTIANHSPGSDPAYSSYVLYSRGLHDLLLVFREPKKDAGKKILVKRNSIWFYFPKAGAPIVMNAAQTLSGSAAIGDVTSPPVLDLYVFTGSAKIADPELGECVRMEFSAKDKTAPYGRAAYFYRDGKIVYAESYARSGLLMKKAWFDGYVEQKDGSKYATKIKAVNALMPGCYSLILISAFTPAESIPEYYFTPEGLSRIPE